MRDILDTLNTWLQHDHPIYMATVTKTWGSSPRQVGAKMIFRDDLAIMGSVSGGCIESDVIETGLAMPSASHYLTYGVSDDTAWRVGLSCGGEIHVYVERLDAAWWRALMATDDRHQRHYTISAVQGQYAGHKLLVNANGGVLYASGGLSPEVCAVWSALALGCATSQEISTAESLLFVDVHLPQPRLIIVGGSHVAIPLHSMAKMLGFHVTLVDPRKAFATAVRFTEIDDMVHQYPAAAFAQLGIDANTYIVLLTHDPKIDDPAVLAALSAEPAYIGILSSRKTHAKRVTRLRAAGLSDSQLSRLHTPIGLDIGAKTPEEIAVSIMAELVAVKNAAAT